ncbi:UNVERIFIED_CONTAM: hypothetical protein Sradi_0881500 [Sesamum radiatum]|uniref:Endonuclease/exonuclease/phosphatase domain-containing protein n=1 Tax=Sesamum radiatum TaxID=300843 RepID=A0AAW2V4X4_SESRA
MYVDVDMTEEARHSKFKQLASVAPEVSVSGIPKGDRIISWSGERQAEATVKAGKHEEIGFVGSELGLYIISYCGAIPPNAMKILSWNYQGLGPPLTIRALMELIKLYMPGLVFLFETKCKARRVERIKNIVSYNSIGVDSVRRGGGLFLLWRKDIDVWIQCFLVHHIDAIMLSESCPDRWSFTGFYGHTGAANRKGGWNLLKRLARLLLPQVMVRWLMKFGLAG